MFIYFSERCKVLFHKKLCQIAGIGAISVSFCLLTGCSIINSAACNAMPAGNGMELPYFRSPKMGTRRLAS
ncbi:hypothetical protein HOV93_19900 [Planctomycetes bacterium FF15]|uniref:Lipoprotein n=1 Tax=Bremerella alba TaxID=980252 RepID=A0A7V8V4J6_9BACT|nr:hypothetical protein [Bremerella alba]